MSKFVAVVGVGNIQTQATNHNFEGVLAGDVESVRERLVYALGRAGYRVISEQPLVARREGGAPHCSFDVLKSVKGLTVGLKSLNPTSTLVTFDYEIMNSLVTKGDRRTVELEAEAVLALARAGQGELACAYCGTSNSGDSRFCRSCGRPHEEGEPAELETLRLTAGARPAYQMLTAGLIFALAVAAIAIPLIFLSSKGPKAGLMLLIMGELSSMVLTLSGMYRLHTTLNPKSGSALLQQDKAARSIMVSEEKLAAAALPPHTSVTEGTTELLTPPERERVAVGIRRRKVDTAEMR